MSLDQDDRSFLQRCKTSALVPADNNAPLQDILNSEPDVIQRTGLYFDENLRILILLDIPPCSEEKLQSYISNIEIRLDTWATAGQNGDDRSQVDGASMRDLISSISVARNDDPFTLVKEVEGEVVLQLVWEVRLDLGRPRFRSLYQTITFLPVITVSFIDTERDRGDLLEPFAAFESNILDPLNGYPGVKGQPYLPASRFEKIMQVNSKKDDKIRIKHLPPRPIPAYAVVVPRLKYSKINTSMPHPSTLATLDIDTIPINDMRGVIESVTVNLDRGTAAPMIPNMLPFSWRSKDCLSFLYELKSASPPMEATKSGNSSPSVTANPNVDTLSVSILVTVELSTDSTATVKMSWTANVDFSLALNPSFGAPSQTLQRTNRPSSLNFSPYPDPNKGPKGPSKIATSVASTRTASTSLQHQVIPTSIPGSETSVILVSLIAPDEAIKVAIPFSWRISVVNNSLKAVKLAIVPLARIQRATNVSQQFAKKHAPKASNVSVTSMSKPVTQTSRGHTRNALSTAKAFVDEQVLYALHHQTSSAVPLDTDLVSLTSEIRIGSLGIGQCYETEIHFIAYRSGTFSVDAIRIVDLTKEAEGGVGTVTDIRDLPEITVIDAIEQTMI